MMIHVWFAGARARVFAAAVAISCLVPGSDLVGGQERQGGGPWFGLHLPRPSGDAPAVIAGPRGPRPVIVPHGDPAAPELAAAAIRADLDTIVGFARESREQREIGAGQLWGRIAGFPSAARTVAWAVDQFRRAGVDDVKTQPFTQDAKASFWLPLSWEVRLLGDPAFGPGSADLVLTSSMPLSPSTISGGALTAPLVFVGSASPALVQHIDVKGKIAVQLVIPQAHMVFERDPVVPRGRALFERGAVAVINVMRQPGNELARDFSDCGGPCFNLGGRDGFFLERVLDRAASAGLKDAVRARLSLSTETRSGLSAENGVAVVPGRRPGESVIVNAHVDAWFDGAGDNADGLAVMVALARHFAKPERRPGRTLVFVASAGHHSPGLNGPRAFLAANPAFATSAVLMLNIEHVAQRHFSPARSVGPDGYRDAIADSGEAPVVAGVSNGSPFLNGLFDEGVRRYGVNFVSDRSAMESGETGGYRALNIARLTIMQAPPLYHTTGETTDVISTPGLERIARFFAYFLKEVDKAPAERINPPTR
jgi:hypothetical protein